MPYAVLDQSNGTASREAPPASTSTGVFQPGGDPATRGAGRYCQGHRWRGDNTSSVLHMGSDFEERLTERRRQRPAQLILDGRNSTTYRRERRREPLSASL
ncbi:hypothetical protein ACPA9J_27215 [Pseudomonas aeruginosa]